MLAADKDSIKSITGNLVYFYFYKDTVHEWNLFMSLNIKKKKLNVALIFIHFVGLEMLPPSKKNILKSRCIYDFFLNFLIYTINENACLLGKSIIFYNITKYFF